MSSQWYGGRTLGDKRDAASASVTENVRATYSACHEGHDIRVEHAGVHSGLHE
jgi:hypothetical protein